MSHQRDYHQNHGPDCAGLRVCWVWQPLLLCCLSAVVPYLLLCLGPGLQIGHHAQLQIAHCPIIMSFSSMPSHLNLCGNFFSLCRGCPSNRTPAERGWKRQSIQDLIQPPSYQIWEWKWTHVYHEQLLGLVLLFLLLSNYKRGWQPSVSCSWVWGFPQSIPSIPLCTLLVLD